MASCFLGYLALTKICFGYAITAMIALVLFSYLWKRSAELKKALLVYLCALIFCLPYLYYTYSLTGRAFYWGNSGGMSLYWMATPYEGESGDWKPEESFDANPQIAKNHGDFFKSMANLNYVQKDDELKRKAIYNITHNPAKFLKNWIANIGRLLFSYPYSYTPQRLSTFFYLIPNMFIVVLSFLCIYPAYRGRKSVPYEISSLLSFALITFGGSTLLSGYSRQFCILVPISRFGSLLHSCGFSR